MFDLPPVTLTVHLQTLQHSIAEHLIGRNQPNSILQKQIDIWHQGPDLLTVYGMCKPSFGVKDERDKVNAQVLRAQIEHACRQS